MKIYNNIFETVEIHVQILLDPKNCSIVSHSAFRDHSTAC